MSTGLSLEEAKRQWGITIQNNGGVCPCCNRWGKIYKRGLNDTMAKSLIWLYQAQGKIADAEGWVDVPNKAPKSIVRTNQLSLLKWWGLVERKPNDKTEKTKHSGMWRITVIGMQFVMRLSKVPKYVYTYNDIPQDYSREVITIEEAFTLAFEYADLMKSPFTSR